MTKTETRDPNAGVATPAENARLDHSVGGVTTRDDRLDAGVPMKQGQAGEPVGPEDALGRGEKRGDYSDRVPGNPHTSVAVEGGGQPVTRYVDRETGAAAKEGDDGAVAVTSDLTPTSVLEAQAPRTADVGDAKGKKGGVDTEREAGPVSL